jgi:hypothetical protein
LGFFPASSGWMMWCRFHPLRFHRQSFVSHNNTTQSSTVKTLWGPLLYGVVQQQQRKQMSSACKNHRRRRRRLVCCASCFGGLDTEHQTLKPIWLLPVLVSSWPCSPVVDHRRPQCHFLFCFSWLFGFGRGWF